MGTSFRELFKLYDLIQCGESSNVERYLKENSIDLNIILPCKGIGVLHLAVGIEPLEKSKKCTEMILKYGGDPNIVNEDGLSPVHIAAIWGRVENLKLLIGCGGDPSRKDIDGISAFDYAAREQQWEVFDYLRNVVDVTDDSFGSQCAYTLDLDKILVTTDQVVAEYEPITDDQLSRMSIRKSEMVRDWCDKNTITMNKLYPTILSETYLLDHESEPWLDDLTNDLDDTINTYKTCKSKDIQISGIQPLEQTVENTQSTETKQRLSVYKNFSLPGSPNITHINYHTKSSLKKKDLFRDTRELDKAMIVVQNKTNEWLSCEEKRVCNTRRSSASSGVSSNFSGSIVLANVHEDFKYEDKEEDVVLIERRVRVSPIVLPIEEGNETSPDQTILSVASSLPPSMDYDTDTLRAELTKLGFKPGPILENTKTLYLKKLHALKKNPIISKRNEQGKSYSVELERSLRNNDWIQNLSPYIELENKAKVDFLNPNKKWREGTAKTSFTYLLLDPRLTNNLPGRAGQIDPHTSWVTFVNSIFYVGKGKRSRPYSHLYQALTLWKRDFKQSKDKKVQHILDIWSDQVGVICLHIFQNVIPAEAYTYEASMIDVLGLQNLKNLKTGNYYGVAASWPLKERRMLGLYLLYKAMNIFLSEGERQLRPNDID
ncbi:ankyrin repeat and LEM domain-containing protein 1-like [Pieris napi]|uniref:ankyrin repeat and LEM domain-containing protein 1-like n=1 Tax=Pieris napi TaxID=78633 RepID=UPI001FBA6747|nr:ankyrin repeat and LEM domain-containing protein 1-like [Pieris napi]